DFALLLADDNGDLSLAHPGKLTLALGQFLLIPTALKFFLQRDNALLPVLPDEPMHSHCGDLVDRHKHRLATLPLGGMVLDSVGGDGVETLFGGDDVVVPL